MQYAKDEIRERILDAARKEFLEKGFEKGSIRTITAKAGTSKSNLYNYFPDKDALFRAVLEPAVGMIRAGIESAGRFNVPRPLSAYTQESQSFVIGVVNRFVAEHLVEMKLLLFKSQGSSLEGFKAEVLEAFTDNMVEWTESLNPVKPLSRFFVRSVCSFYIGLMEQMLQAGKSEDMERLQDEFARFVYHGWKGVLGR